MKVHSSKGILVLLAMLCMIVPAPAQPTGDNRPARGVAPDQVPGDPVCRGVMQKMGARFTPEVRSTVESILAQCGSEMDKCQVAFAREVAEVVTVPADQVLGLFPRPGGEAAHVKPEPLGMRLARLLGRSLNVEERKRLRLAGERQATCADPWQDRLVEQVAAATGLSRDVVLALTPWAGKVARMGGSDGLGDFDTDGPGDFASSFLKGAIRVCNGTVRPQGTDRVLMPLMAANRERFKGKSVLDIGTGSGILALYAAQLGAAKVVATDIEPRALECTRENARRLGVEPLIETRLVRPESPLAYSVIRPGEVFDIIVGAPPADANRTPVVTSGTLDEGVTSNDTIKLGLSIVDGLREHLSQDGAALLFYPSDLMLPIVVRYASHLGFRVQYHPALQLQPADWYALYNTFAVQVARTERVPPSALLLPPVEIALGSLAFGQYRKLDWTLEGLAYPQLWDEETERLFLGMIVIRKSAAQPGSPPR